MQSGAEDRIEKIIDNIDLFSLEKISDDVLSDIESLVKESPERFVIGTFKGLFIIKIGKTVKCLCRNTHIEEKEKNKILSYLLKKDLKPYSVDFYRVDLEKFILIFKMYRKDNEIILVGHVVENNEITKVDIVTARAEIEFSNIKETLKIYRQSLRV